MHGKIRASKNARRHGVSAFVDSVRSTEIENFAREIIRNDSTTALELARIRLDRYARRALSRRQFAVRVDLATRQAGSAVTKRH